MKRILAVIAAAAVLFTGTLVVIMAPAINAMSKFGVVDFDNGLKIFTGAGGNSVVYMTPDRASVVIVDTKMGGGSKKLKAYADSINPGAGVTVINTHAHPDHVGGNKLFPKAEFITGGYENPKPGTLTGRLIKAGDTYTIKTADEEIEIRNMGAAHSFADTVVYFKKRKLLVTGDLVFNGWHPVLVKQGGADTDKWVKALEYLIRNYDIKTAVPGHGKVSGNSILLAQKSYFEGIKAALSDPAKLKALREKFGNYMYVPFFSGFDKTVQFISGIK